MIVASRWFGTAAIELTYRDESGRTMEAVVYREDEPDLAVVDPGRRWAFDAPGKEFRLAAEARRIRMAYLFDPMLAVSISAIDPLPHQIQAVYGEMLPRIPLRFLLADDPGAGKTIMAGLYIKELMLRGDVARCLIVAPGGLVVQWQEELYEKFGLRFEIVTRDMIDASYAGEVFQEKNLLIARVDQLSRNDELVERLKLADWDLVVVDEAHRMSAHFYGSEVKKTKRYLLGEVLGSTARHFLLMTATPHAGKNEDFQLFMALLDADRFEGTPRDGLRQADPADMMRRMVKERLLRFDGTPLFPERRAYTVTYPLSADEMRLYDEVTEYVREEMNRADRLAREGQGRRGNTVGFALTVLQRRLASSPEAIYQSLHRRRKRLEKRIVDEKQQARLADLGMTAQEERLAILIGDSADTDIDIEALDDLDAEEAEDLERVVVDSATTATTVAELQEEIKILAVLEQVADQVRASGVDRKWMELSRLLEEEEAMRDIDGNRRKLIIFTEHRDTMTYLVDRLRTWIGAPEAVVAINGGTSRDERRAVQQRFTQDKDCLILVATDAAGEGINLQRAHLVINYDLPWNPNRIEQRFGRVHRIGQTEVCHMWNLVARETRESQVYLRLLDKIEEQRKAYKGQVFDVLGEAISSTQLRELLIEAIRYGEQEEVRDRINQVIDDSVGEKVREAIEHPPLAAEILGSDEVEGIRRRMEEIEARRLQPHYVRSFFFAAFEDLGGRWVEREPGRFELPSVPAVIRNRDRLIGTGAPVVSRYQRVVFEKKLVRVEGTPQADLLAPGHPLVDSVVDLVLEKYRTYFTQGSVLVDDSDESPGPRVLVMLEHAIVDARPTRDNPYTVVSRRFEFVEVFSDGTSRAAGFAPYLDYRPLADVEAQPAQALLNENWLHTDIDEVGRAYAVEHVVPQHLAEVRATTDDRVERTRDAVKQRLTAEINYWDARAAQLREQADAGNQPRMNPDRAQGRANKLSGRLATRMTTLEQEASIRPLPPVVVGAAFVMPATAMPEVPEPALPSALDRKVVEDRAVDAVLATERRLGRDPIDMNEIRPNNPGFDIRSNDSDGSVWFIEVKGRIEGSDTVTVTRNEMLTGLNKPERFILALVEVGLDGSDSVCYVANPFANVATLFGETSRTFALRDLQSVGEFHT